MTPHVTERHHASTLGNDRILFRMKAPCRPGRNQEGTERSGQVAVDYGQEWVNIKRLLSINSGAPATRSTQGRRGRYLSREARCAARRGSDVMLSQPRLGGPLAAGVGHLDREA